MKRVEIVADQLDEVAIRHVQTTLAELRPNKSGISFTFHRGLIALFPPQADYRGSSDEELFLWYERRHGLNYEDFGVFIDSESYRRDLIARARAEKPLEFIGGIGITGRTLNDLCRGIPSLKEKLHSQTGKVIFLGNGFSAASLDVARLYEDGKVNVAPVVVDIFDYEDALEDVFNVIAKFKQSGLPILFPLDQTASNLRGLVEAKKRGFLKTVKYLVGSGKLPPSLTRASVIINSYGPSRQSLSEQLSMLAAGGEYFYVGMDGDLHYKAP